MTQAQIYTVMKFQPDKWFDVKELSDILNIQTPSVGRSVRILSKCGDIEKDRVRNKQGYKHQYKFIGNKQNEFFKTQQKKII